MKLKYTRTSYSITVTKEYDPGEKYRCTIGWTRNRGVPTKERVEYLYPDCTFIGIKRYRGICPSTLDLKTFTHVLVERVQS